MEAAFAAPLAKCLVNACCVANSYPSTILCALTVVTVKSNISRSCSTALCGGQKMAPRVNKWSPRDGAHKYISHCDSHQKQIIVVQLSLYNDSAT